MNIKTIFLIVCLSLAGFAQEKPAVQPDNEEALREAVQRSAGSQTELIKNLEAYLQKFPGSAHRNDIESNLYKISMEMRDRNNAILYAERMAKSGNNDVDALTNLVTMLRERRGAGDLPKALSYAETLVKEIEQITNTSRRPGRYSQAQWDDRKNKGLASVYLLRARANADLNNDSAAKSDANKSYNLGKLAGAAAVLGEIAERNKSIDEALNQYLLAFAISVISEEDIDRKGIRAKLGQLHTSKYGSETGLGDKLLKAYDAYGKEYSAYLAKLNGPDINAGMTDPLQFKLTRIDGSAFKLADFQGKIVVVNFWATWCGPCLTEMPLLEKTATKYKDDANVVFLALATDEERDEVAPFVKEHKFKLPTGYAEHLEDHFRVTSIPTTIIFDRKGEIAFRQAGFNPREDFVEMMSGRIEDAKKR
jgi:thiol-disulfide isomerase/thioredoxin